MRLATKTIKQQKPRRGGLGALFGVVAAILAGCGQKPMNGALVSTQTPPATSAAKATDILDDRYPEGTRVVVTWPPYAPDKVRVLSQNLVAAGGPVVCPDGKRILFVGKSSKAGPWQIYEVKASGGGLHALTSMPGGAMDPGIIGNGDLVFSSPVPKLGEEWSTKEPAALYAQTPGRAPRRLTYGSHSALEPTVLRDGRILFVSAYASDGPSSKPSVGLFTVNNDGTEFTAFGLDNDGAPNAHRPRELSDGRVGFIASDAGNEKVTSRVEGVRTARPFLSRGPLFPFASEGCRSVEPWSEDQLLICLPNLRGAAPKEATYAVFALASRAAKLEAPLFHNPAWDTIEAVAVTSRPTPMGHISAMAPEKRYGTILCLNVDFTRPEGNGAATNRVERVRVLRCGANDQPCALGEVAVQPDGSFMAQVPADIPLGFEALDHEGKVLRRLPPSLWVRAGENRSCLGCHEPPNRSPKNQRPMAVALPPVTLWDNSAVAGKNP